MTPLEVITSARQQYNAVGDDFFSDQELYDILFAGSQEFSKKAFAIERSFSVSSVASQQQYNWPTNAIRIKRITYDGIKLAPFTFRDDDVLTQLDQAIGTVGVPSAYAVWEKVFYLRPIPSEIKTIEVLANVRPQRITVTSTLEIDEEYQMNLVDLILEHMNRKEKNYTGAQYHRGLWNDAMMEAKKQSRLKVTGDAFKVVRNVDAMMQTSLGYV